MNRMFRMYRIYGDEEKYTTSYVLKNQTEQFALSKTK